MKIILSLLLIFYTSLNYSNDGGSLQKEDDLSIGVYRSFSDFQGHRRTLYTDFHIDTVLRKKGIWKGTYRFKPMTKGEPILNIWGFCDGKHNYVAFKKDYFKLIRENENQIVYSYAENKISNMTILSLFGSAAGGIIYHKTLRGKSKKAVQKYYLDPYTGGLVTSKEVLNFFDQENRYAKLIIYRLDKESSIKAVNLTISDSIKISLVNNSYFELNLPLRRHPYTLEVENNNKKTDFFLYLYNTAYLKCSTNTAGENKVDIHWMQIGKGLYEASEAKSIQEKRQQKE